MLTSWAKKIKSTGYILEEDLSSESEELPEILKFYSRYFKQWVELPMLIQLNKFKTWFLRKVTGRIKWEAAAMSYKNTGRGLELLVICSAI